MDELSKETVGCPAERMVTLCRADGARLGLDKWR